MTNLPIVPKKPRHAVSYRLPRLAALAVGAVAVAATAGIALTQIDSPQAANASSSVKTMSVTGTSIDASGRQTKVAGQPAPATPTQPAAPSSKELGYQFALQPNYYYCGPAATRIALSASGHILSFDQIAGLLGTTTSGTNSAYDITRGLNSVLGGNGYQTREIPAYPATPAQMDQLQADVLKSINAGRVIVANIAGHLNDTAGTYHSYEGGHYLTIVGYKDDGRTVKIADPANPNGDGTYWVTTINMANWIAQRGYAY